MNQNSWTKFTLIQHYGCTNIAAKDQKLHQKSIKTTFELHQNSSITIASKSALNLHQHHHQKALELHQKQQQKITVTTTKQLQNCTRKAPKTDSKIAPKKQHHIRTKTTQKLHQTAPDSRRNYTKKEKKLKNNSKI